MIMEDLDASGFSLRRNAVDVTQLTSCLNWLAAFHACFMHQQPDGLWPTGSYWHLDTRPDELAAMPNGALKDHARRIDALLNNTAYASFVHGDAKLANFCFSNTDARVAAVDFQYVGGGCGMRDVAYFISSCLDDRQCEVMQDQLLDIYFGRLHHHLMQYQPDIDASAVEDDWRPLYEVAWADFLRFLTGWSPGHWKIHGYSQQVAERVLRSL